MADWKTNTVYRNYIAIAKFKDVVDIKAELNNKCDTETVKQLVSSEIKTLTNDIDEKKVMEIVKSEAHKLKEPNNADSGSNIRDGG